MARPAVTDNAVTHNAVSSEDARIESAIVVDDRALPGAKASPTVEKALRLSIAGGLLLLPLWFGGVHAEAFLPYHLIAPVLALMCLSFAKPFVDRAFGRGSVSRILGLGLSLAVAYALLQWGWQRSLSTPHPVLERASLDFSYAARWRSLSSLIAFAAVFFIARVWLEIPKNHGPLLRRFMIICGITVSFVALTHWFYDNGRLFWTFEPDNLFISDRARWPFVNPNHLAHFLLPVFFLLTSHVLLAFRQAELSFRTTVKNAKGKASRVLTSAHLQRNLIRMLLLSVFAACIAVCIIGSLSRAIWFSFAAALVLFLWAEKKLSRAEDEETPPETADAAAKAEVIDISALEQLRSSRHRRAHSSRPQTFETNLLALLNSTKRVVRPVLFLGAAIIFVFFLNGRGLDLVEGRLEYGLKNTKDDIRWQLYQDTLPMIFEHPIAGVGFGSWESAYERYRSKELAGTRPVYLHSDILQLAAELGGAGALLWAAVFVIFFIRLVRALPHLPQQRKYVLLGLAAGLFFGVIAAALDFPFRMPAIQFYWAVYLAWCAYAIDSASDYARDGDSLTEQGAHS